MLPKMFNFGSKKIQPQSCSSTQPRRDSGIDGTCCSEGYHLRDKDMGRIHRAASIGNEAKVQELLLQKKHEIDEPDKLNRTPLHLACASGYPDVVSLLVERNCKLNVCDSENRTPLIKAVQCQQEECVSILLNHGADPDVVDTTSNTALHYAALGDNTTIAAKLLEHKANIEAKNQTGYTPLVLAVRKHNEAMVDVFLKNGANVNVCDNSKRTPLMIALSTSTKPTNIINLILEYDVDLSCQDDYGWTAKDYASISGVHAHRDLVLQHEKKQLDQLLSAGISSTDVTSDTVFALAGSDLAEEDNKDEKKAHGSGGPENRETGLNVLRKEIESYYL
ncbi:ankyrin repeat domain-containing protein 7-like [Gracilinanus agilis]|uniref:ankyrin repeat domain-containing protein 7-like n=1 Tax=Gracilinanus agilis TaxID=191870 RepID=UPI001CFC9E4C|nr:ankyrin repeat domain-containing protein 7-like [Gracilinanus agilis]